MKSFALLFLALVGMLFAAVYFSDATIVIPMAEAAIPPVARTTAMADHADYSKCPDPTLPSVSCQTPVTYGTCQVYSYGESGVREFVCDGQETHSFASGLDTYLGVNRTQTVESMLPEWLGYLDTDARRPFHCPWASCDEYLVVTRQKAESAR